MRFIEKVTSVNIVLKILISLTKCFPQTKSSNVYNTVIQSPRHLVDDDIWNEFQAPLCVCERRIFPDIEHPLDPTPKPKCYFQDFKKRKNLLSKSLQCLTKNNPSFDNGAKIEYILPAEFTSAPNYRNIYKFPEVEYPLTAKEMWKPNFWIGPSDDYSFKYVNDDSICINPDVYDSLPPIYPLKNNKLKLKPGNKPYFATKSFSDSNKNVIALKQREPNGKLKNEINNNTEQHLLRINDNIILNNENKENSINIPLEKQKHISEVTNCDNLNIYNEFLSPDLTKNRRSQNSFTNSDKEYSIPSLDFESKIADTDKLISTYVDNFNKEMTSIINSKTSNQKQIFENNIAGFQKEAMSQNQQTSSKDENNHYENIMYDSKLRSATVDSIADKFNNEMNLLTSSVANNINLNINSAVDFLKEDWESRLATNEQFVNSYADKLNDEMTAIIKSAADNILLNKFESKNINNKNQFNRIDSQPQDARKPENDITRSYAENYNNRKTPQVEYNKNNMNYPTGKIDESKNSMPVQTTSNSPCYTKSHKSQDANNNNYKTNLEQEVCRESDYISKTNNKTFINRNNEMNKDEKLVNNKVDEKFMPTQGKEKDGIPKSNPDDSELDQEDTFTTDDPDNGDWSSYGLSTPAPQKSKVDSSWRGTSIIEPVNQLHSDELSEYFLLV